MTLVDGHSNDVPIDRRVVQLRSYMLPAPPKPPKQQIWDGDYVLVFDTETTTDPAQRLQFGAYQVRYRGRLVEAGLFHGELSSTDKVTLETAFAALRPSKAGETLKLLSRQEFVDNVLMQWGYRAGGLIVGFNLPFDISRIAVSYKDARSAMKGGFSFDLREPGKWPTIRVKHRSQRSAFIDFPQPGKNQPLNKGFFLDVKTFAATLLSRSFSLGGLAGHLGTTPKVDIKSHDGPLTIERVNYGFHDPEVTWQCFDALYQRYQSYGLSTGVEKLYSEASLGKAFLQAMNIKPWREVQTDFPPARVGQIMSAYFGGRAEVHIRRVSTPVIHCDFLSMYPTVCTLMGLWRYVIAEGIEEADATTEVCSLLETVTREDLRDQRFWNQLQVLVQVAPLDDVFPVRAAYDRQGPSTIGLNRLSSEEPLWFTLADVLASKLLSGKAPKVLQAVRFSPKEIQKDLKSIGFGEVSIDPAEQDFYRLLIDERKRIDAEADATNDPSVKARLKAEQQSLKILANSTSYGIFVELNVERFDRREVTFYGYDGRVHHARSDKGEKPGRYFHPLLATLITGAARLMLALAEQGALDEGLDWAFCDTDSLAIADTRDLPPGEFIRRVENVRRWFEALNPYQRKGSILQLEKVNFPIGRNGDLASLRPTNCLAISAKRYVLFDRDPDDSIEIRKASRHGLGHLLPPYVDPDRGERMDRLGVELWQENFWREVILAHDGDKPDQVTLEGLAGFQDAGATRYAATNPQNLSWFSTYNQTVPVAEQVWPFNFLLVYQAKSKLEMAHLDQDALDHAVWISKKSPAPTSRYSSDLVGARPPVFDRNTNQPMDWGWLRTYARSLRDYHLHPEGKFRGGDFSDRGFTTRRHVKPFIVRCIGKEADNLDEREVLGDNEEDAVEWPFFGENLRKLLEPIRAVLDEGIASQRTLIGRAGVTRTTLMDALEERSTNIEAIIKLAEAADTILEERVLIHTENQMRLALLHKVREQVGGRDKLAALLDVDGPHLGRVLSEKRPMTRALFAKLIALTAAGPNPGSCS
jgi:hypothetical protein